LLLAVPVGQTEAPRDRRAGAVETPIKLGTSRLGRHAHDRGRVGHLSRHRVAGRGEHFAVAPEMR